MKWQCDQSDENHIYPLDEDDEDDESYQPTKATLELFAAATGASLSSLRSMIIGSGLPSASAPKGSWCGMPAAGNMIGVHGGANRSGQQELAYQYWQTCVSTRAGYFNVLQCEGQCDGGNCSTYAVLGYAALEPSVCYAAHQHLNEEAYWQIAGRGWWRTWSNVTEVDDHEWASNTNFGGSKYAFHPHRRGGVPHEFDTTNHLDGDGDAGELEELVGKGQQHQRHRVRVVQSSPR
jgi:hypothetical protein